MRSLLVRIRAAVKKSERLTDTKKPRLDLSGGGFFLFYQKRASGRRRIVDFACWCAVISDGLACQKVLDAVVRSSETRSWQQI